MTISSTLAKASALLLAVLGTALLPAAAQTPAEAIRAAAIAATGAAPGEVDARIDPRVRMPECPQPLAAQPISARMVQVSCPAPPGWRLYVPVQVRRVQEVAVVVAPVPAGEPVTAEQVRIERRETGGLVTVQDPASVIGAVARRPLAPGAVLGAGDLSQGPPLKRGDPVVLVSSVGGVEVRMEGRALGAAAQDGVVAVENVVSRRIVRGRWRGEGVVEVLR